MMSSTVIPVLNYPDVNAAAEWLCNAFGFTVRLRIGDHRVQLNVGSDGALVVRAGAVSTVDSAMIRVPDVDAHYAHAVKHGARPVSAPADFPFGERQYSVEDFAGRAWTFSQSIADVEPGSWGGTT